MTVVNYQNKHFLIIDHIKPSHDILKRFAMSLSSQQVDSTLYAQDVIPMCLEKQYDIVLLGYNLGDKQKNGQQILEELRRSEVLTRHCVVIMITAEISQAMVLAALEHKPDGYLCKPYTLQELKKRLNKCLAKKNAMASIYQAIESNDKELTILLVNKALKNNTPYKAECLGIKSRQLFDLGQFEQAEKIYHLYQNEVNCEWASIGLGKIALHNKDFSHAEVIFKNLIEQKPLYLPSYDWLALTYQKEFNTIHAEEVLEDALKLSPRSIVRLKNYGNICFDNEHYQKATEAYSKVYSLASNSIHQTPDTAIMYAKSLAGYSADLPIIDAKKMNNRAFSMFSHMLKSFPQADLKIQSYLISANLLENIHNDFDAKDKLQKGLSLLEKEQHNISAESLTSISDTLLKLNRRSKASQILSTAQKQQNNTSTQSDKIGELSNEQLNENNVSKAQKALEHSKQLFEERKFAKAKKSLNEALVIVPHHIGIKLNLLQVLLASYEESRLKSEDLFQAKKIILELLYLTKENDEYIRFKKMKKKYQRLAGI